MGEPSPYLPDKRRFKIVRNIILSNASRALQRTWYTGRLTEHTISCYYPLKMDGESVYLLVALTVAGSAADYWLFKSLMKSWSVKGIDILFQKVFEDDFIIQEMAHFHTSVI